jgi:hypothetical protein
MWNAKLKAIIGVNLKIEPKHQKWVNDLIGSLTIIDVEEITEGKYQVLAAKLHKSIKDSFENQAFSPAIRKELAQSIAKEIKNFLKTSKEIEPNVLPGFEPNTVLGDTTEIQLNNIVEELFAFIEGHKDLKKFTEMVQRFFTELVGNNLAELAEGFTNGLSDVNILLKENIANFFSQLGPDDFGGAFASILTDQVMEIIHFYAQVFENNKPKTTIPVGQIPEEKKQILATAVLPKEEKKDVVISKPYIVF